MGDKKMDMIKEDVIEENRDVSFHEKRNKKNE